MGECIAVNDYRYEPYFTLEKKDYIATVTLSRPEKNNTIGFPFYYALLAVQEERMFDKNIRVVLLLADGKHFSAGTDLEYMAQDRMKMEDGGGRALYGIQQWQGGFSFFENFDIPVVCGIQGACLGSGVELISSCDIRIAAENSNYFMGEVKVGQCTDLGGATRLTRLIGRSQALRLLLTAERIGAEEALRIGLVDKVVPTEDVRKVATEYARTIAKMSPFAVMTTKRVVNIAANSDISTALTAERIHSGYIMQTKDRVTAMKAMMAGGEYAPEFTLE